MIVTPRSTSARKFVASSGKDRFYFSDHPELNTQMRTRNFLAQQHQTSIYRYDKRKYRDEDFDDRSMENNKFSSIMMEEARLIFKSKLS